MAEPFTPQPVRVLRDLAEIKALSDPLRIRILDTLRAGSDRSWTVKEIAATIGEPATKLYHHVKLLEQVDLVRDVETRMVSGIVEHRYRIGQLSMRVDDELFRSSATRDDTAASLASVLDGARDEVLTRLLRGVEDAQVALTKLVTRVSPRDAQRLEQEVTALIRRLEAERDADGDDDTETGGLTVVLLAYPEPAPQAADG